MGHRPPSDFYTAAVKNYKPIPTAVHRTIEERLADGYVAGMYEVDEHERALDFYFAARPIDVQTCPNVAAWLAPHVAPDWWTGMWRR